MAKKAYIGVEGVARKIKKGYIGVDNVARKIKKVYIGIGGVARPCWSGGELVRYGMITSLPVETSYADAASVGNCAIFSGFRYFDYSGTLVYGRQIVAYDANLTQTTKSGLYDGGLYDGRINMSCGSIGNYAVFAGGSGSSGMTTTVDGFDASLTRASASSLAQARTNAMAARVGDRLVFLGGTILAGTQYAEFYDKSLSRSYAEVPLASVANSGGASSVGNYALFCGGTRSGVQSKAVAFDSSLTRHDLSIGLSQARSSLSATTVAGFALFAGGMGDENDVFNTVDVFDGSLTRSNPVSLPSPRRELLACTVENFAVFAGGYGPNYYTEAANVYGVDDSLTLKEVGSLAETRATGAAASVGKYALFGGDGKTNQASVEAYVVN